MIFLVRSYFCDISKVNVWNRHTNVLSRIDFREASLIYRNRNLKIHVNTGGIISYMFLKSTCLNCTYEHVGNDYGTAI